MRVDLHLESLGLDRQLASLDHIKGCLSVAGRGKHPITVGEFLLPEILLSLWYDFLLLRPPFSVS